MFNYSEFPLNCVISVRSKCFSVCFQGVWSVLTCSRRAGTNASVWTSWSKKDWTPSTFSAMKPHWYVNKVLLNKKKKRGNIACKWMTVYLYCFHLFLTFVSWSGRKRLRDLRGPSYHRLHRLLSWRHGAALQRDVLQRSTQWGVTATTHVHQTAWVRLSCALCWSLWALQAVRFRQNQTKPTAGHQTKGTVCKYHWWTLLSACL